MLTKAVSRVAMSVFLVLTGSATASDDSKALTEHRIIPIRSMSEDVEILYGDPEAVGEPFVMRIRELPGGIIPPHRHPVDEHITVLQGTLYFGVGEKFDRAAMKEMKAGSYAFIPNGSTILLHPRNSDVQVHEFWTFLLPWVTGLMA